MLIRVGYDLTFRVPAPTPMLLTLYTHPSRAAYVRRADRFRVEPGLPIQEFTDAFGNRCGRLVAPAGQLRLSNNAVVEDSGQPDEVCPWARQTPVELLPLDVLPFLFASRYCEVDRLTDIAWQLFRGATVGWGRVQAICNWVHNNVRFGYQYARPTKTAFDVFTERAGVCRDFAHLAITFCRCMAIPARYATGYLGDIGVPSVPSPMDFSAWFEVYLNDRWFTFDARHNVPRIGRVLMARGRDAVDVALTTSFGQTTIEKFIVWTDEVHETREAVVAYGS